MLYKQSLKSLFLPKTFKRQLNIYQRTYLYITNALIDGEKI